MNLCKKLLPYVLGSAIFLGNTSHAAEILLDSNTAETILSSDEQALKITLHDSLSKENIAADIAILAEMLPPEKDSLSAKTQQMIDTIIDLSEDDAASAAIALNKITDDKTYEAALHEVLDHYYADDRTFNDDKLTVFANVVDDRADTILSDYAEAKEERDNQENLDYEVGKILVSFESEMSNEEIEIIAEHMGNGYSILNDIEIDSSLPDYKLKRLESVMNQSFPTIAYMDIGLDKTVEKAKNLLENMSCVKSSSCNTIKIETETIASDMGGLNDTLVENQYYLTNMNVDDAWRGWTNSNPEYAFYNIDVAVIDTGLDILHPDLKTRYLADKSIAIIKNGTELTIQPMNAQNCYYRGVLGSSHGTHVSGIIAAQSNNNEGVAGIASIYDAQAGNISESCRIMAINAAHVSKNNRNRDCCYFNDSSLIKAIAYAVNNGAEVINMSLGGTISSPEVQEIINYAYAANVTICASAGNDGTSQINYPASYDHVISVASLSQNEKHSTFSNTNSYVDIAAYGEGIQNCVIKGEPYEYTDMDGNFYLGSYTSSYDALSGTSMSCPIIAASAAIIRSMNYNLTATQVDNLLFTSAVDLAPSGKDVMYGYGKANIGLATQYVKRNLLCNTYPKNLALSQKNYQAINIKWTGLLWAERYELYRSTSINGTYTKIKTITCNDYYTTEGATRDASTGIISWIYANTGIETGTTYYYKIRAAFNFGYGENYTQFSPAVGFACTLKTPVISLASTKGKITISWNKINGATGYAVFRSNSKNGTYTRICKVQNGSTLSANDTTVTAGKTYYYKVRAFRTVNNKSTFSQFSEIAQKTAK